MGELTRTLLLIVACAPVLYWLSKIATTYLLCKFSSPHHVTFEYEGKNGEIIHSEKIDVSKDRSFYAAVVKAYKQGQRKEGNA
ncbi:TPA: hypothetical protein ACQJO7_003924 [Vibrio parahaemolyticus]